MKNIWFPVLTAIAIGCAPTPENGVKVVPAPKTDVSQLGIAVEESGLAQLRSKVIGRDDAECNATSVGQLCSIEKQNEIYVFTFVDSPAHPAAMFRGFVELQDGGRVEFQQRGWFAGDEEQAMLFYDQVIEARLLPNRPVE